MVGQRIELAGVGAWRFYVLQLPVAVLLALAPTLSFALDAAARVDAVQHALASVPALAGAQVTATLEDGEVVLHGSVSSLVEKNEAARIAESTAGGLPVVDRIVLTNAPRPDTAIAEDVRANLVERGGFETRQIAVFVIRGKVTLSGAVGSADERRLAEVLARRVEGVREVVSNLIVASAGANR